jgi:hypothetical protein
VRKTWLASLVAGVLLVAQPSLVALIEEPSDRDIANALNMARASETIRTTFHKPYILPYTDDTIERIEIVTEFRRFVLSAEEHLAAGNWMLGRGGFDQKGRTLKDLLRPFAGRVSVRARLRFHPHNSYVALPPFDILVGEPTLVVEQSTRTPHVVAASREGNTRDFIYGATIESFFDAHAVKGRVLPVRIISKGKELARTTADFSRFD